MSGEYSILVHLSNTQLDEYSTCSNIGVADEDPVAAETTVDTGPGPEDAGDTSDSGETSVWEVASSAVGAQSQTRSGMVILLASLTVLSAAIAVGTSLRTRLDRRG